MQHVLASFKKCTHKAFWLWKEFLRVLQYIAWKKGLLIATAQDWQCASHKHQYQYQKSCMETNLGPSTLLSLYPQHYTELVSLKNGPLEILHSRYNIRLRSTHNLTDIEFLHGHSSLATIKNLVKSKWMQVSMGFKASRAWTLSLGSVLHIVPMKPFDWESNLSQSIKILGMEDCCFLQKSKVEDKVVCLTSTSWKFLGTFL